LHRSEITSSNHFPKFCRLETRISLVRGFHASSFNASTNAPSPTDSQTQSTVQQQQQQQQLELLRSSDGGEIPFILHHMVFRGMKSLVNHLLLSQQAEVNEPDQHGNTPLCVATVSS
jgi:ankyrin repeat protein